MIDAAAPDLVAVVVVVATALAGLVAIGPERIGLVEIDLKAADVGQGSEMIGAAVAHRLRGVLRFRCRRLIYGSFQMTAGWIRSPNRFE